VKIRGLLLNPSGSTGPIEVCVNHQSDWESIYKNPTTRVKCLIESCETLLTAKRMSRSGLRFLAVRSGGCTHNLVDMPVERGEVEQDPSELAGGGGPEGDEHRWMKGRLYKIARSLGAEAVVEHSLTRADVFLPAHDLVLEYQRWNTDLLGRTAQRSSKGATRTVWMFPTQPPNAPSTRKLRAFNHEVFEHGGIYVAVRSKDRRSELQKPWEDPSQERTARLYASGSIAVFDPERGALIRRELSLATVLAEIIDGDRVLAHAVVLTKRDGRLGRERVWVLRRDLVRAEAAQEERRRGTSGTTPRSSRQPGQAVQRDIQSTRDAAAKRHDPPLPVDRQASATSVEFPSSRPAAAPSNDHHSTPEEVPRDSLSAHGSITNAPLPTNQSPAPRGPRWKAIVAWFRRA
jgi:hypothetical protein